MLPQPYSALPNSAFVKKHYASGDIVFRQDDPSIGIYYIDTGSVQLIRYTEHGVKVIIHQANNEETFAEASLYSTAYHCDAIALQPTQLYIISKTAILTEMKNSASFSQALTAQFAQQIQNYRRYLMLHSIRKAEDRVFAAISNGMLTTKIITFATKIGLTHEATYRALAKLTKQGKLIKTTHGKYSLSKVHSPKARKVKL